MPDLAHRLLTPANGIHAIHAFTATFPGDVLVTPDDVGKVVKCEPPPEGEGGFPPVVEWYILRAVDDGDPPSAWWQRLLTDSDSIGGGPWVTWDVLDNAALGAIVVELGDVSKVARVANDRAYYVLSDVLDEEGTLIPIWRRLDNVEGGIPITWTVDPEGFPSSLDQIEATADDLHKVALVPSGGDDPKYFVLYAAEYDGEEWDLTWRALDAAPVDASAKADKREDRVDHVGTSHTVTTDDFDKFHVSTNAALQTWTLPNIATDPVRSFRVMQGGAGQVRFVTSGGGTLLPPKTIQTFEQYSLIEVSLIGANTWLVTGDIY